MNQKQSSALIGFDALRKLPKTCMAGDAFTFILDLPDHPLGGEDAAHTQTLVGISRVSVTNCINKSFLKTELKPSGCLHTIHWIEKQL